jgi:hypothetical protein
VLFRSLNDLEQPRGAYAAGVALERELGHVSGVFSLPVTEPPVRF